MNGEDRVEPADEQGLDELFERYRLACPYVEPSVNFMPMLWQKIEARHGFWFTFVRVGRGALTASAAVCLLLVVLNLASTPQITASYSDELLAESSAEQTYFTETARPNQLPDSPAATPQK